MEIAKSIKLLELQTKIVYNIITDSEKLEFETITKELNQGQSGSLKWFKQEMERLQNEMYNTLLEISAENKADTFSPVGTMHKETLSRVPA